MRFHSPDISITAKEKTFFITIIAHAHALLRIYSCAILRLWLCYGCSWHMTLGMNRDDNEPI